MVGQAPFRLTSPHVYWMGGLIDTARRAASASGLSPTMQGRTIAISNSKALWACLAGLLGFGLGLLAGLSSYPAIAASMKCEEAHLSQVVVARRTIPAGTKLGYAVLMRKEIPARYVSSSAVRAEHVSHVVGESTLMTILEGDPVLWSHLASGAPESICDWVRQAKRTRKER